MGLPCKMGVPKQMYCIDSTNWSMTTSKVYIPMTTSEVYIPMTTSEGLRLGLPLAKYYFKVNVSYPLFGGGGGGGGECDVLLAMEQFVDSCASLSKMQKS